MRKIAKVANASGFASMAAVEHIKAVQELLWQGVKNL